jgi:hypothetical protein
MKIGWCFLFAIGISCFAEQCAFKIIDDQKADLVVEPFKRQPFYIPFEKNNILKCRKGYKLVGSLCVLTIESDIRTDDTVTEKTLAEQRIKRQMMYFPGDYTEETHEPLYDEIEERFSISVRCKEGFKLFGRMCKRLIFHIKPTISKRITKRPICNTNEYLVGGVCRRNFSDYIF